MVKKHLTASKMVLASALVALSPLAGFAEQLPRVSEVNGPSVLDRVLSRVIVTQLKRGHLSQHPLDDEISQRTFDTFLDRYDPLKLYFTRGDYEEFARHRTTLDNELDSGNLQFAYDFYKRLLVRVGERMPMVHELIDQQHDFTVDEQIIAEPDLIQYTDDAAEMRDRWRRQIKYEMLDLLVDGKTEEEIRERLHRRYKTREAYRQQEDVYELRETFLSCFTGAYDPHTSYMAPRTDENFNINMNLQLEGIGATLQPEDGYVTIRSLVPGGAADREGTLEIGDQIIGVTQEGATEEVDVVDMKLDDVVSLIRGPAGTKVQLTVKPAKGGENRIVVIERAKIMLEDSRARGEIIEHAGPDGKTVRVGYINLPSFYLDMDGYRENRPDFSSTTRDVRKILNTFTTGGVDVVVLDLAYNGGGSLTEAIDCTGLFIDQGPVVQVKSSGPQSTVLNDEDSGVAWSGPLVVKINQLSASASEILAGAVQDYDRGLIVGDPQTHGKGTVQTLMDMTDIMMGPGVHKESYGALKLTVQQFYRPDGQSTQMIGVASDVILPALTAVADVGESDLDYALPPAKTDAKRHMNYGLMSDVVRVALQERSLGRVKESEDFQRRNRQIEVYTQQKDEKYKSLRLEDFKAARKELDFEQEQEKQIEAQQGGSKVFQDDYYNREVFNIAVDYLTELRKNNLAASGSPAR